jgi:ubiquinone biosynthesis protein
VPARVVQLPRDGQLLGGQDRGPAALPAPGAGGLSPLLADVNEIVRRRHRVLPGHLALLLKAVATGEGTILQLDPSLRLADAAAPYERRLVLQLNSPTAWARRLGHTAPDLVWLATEGPATLRRFISGLEGGAIKVDVQPQGFEPSLRRLERIGNRLVLGMIVAALTVGLGGAASVSHPGAATPALGLFVTAGFLLAAVSGVALIWSGLRRPH